MFYSKQSFLKDIRAHQHPFGDSNNLAQFAKKAVIQYKKPITMYDFIQEADSDDKRLKNTREWVQFYHDVLVTNRIDVLTRFYNSYLYTDEMETLFEEPLFKESVEELTKSLLNESEKTIYIQRKDRLKRLLRNLYAKEMLNDTTITNSIPGKPNFWQSLLNFFQGKIDDRLFAPSSISLYLRDNTLQTPIYLLQQYQSKASIVNPALIYLLLQTKLNHNVKHKKLFTPELSWSSYLLTFLASGEDWNEYIGVDVMDSVIQKSQSMYDLFREKNPKSKKTVKLIQTPSESLLKDKGFLAKYTKDIDTVLYCPPYFDMEIYPDQSGNQSIDKYPTYEKWLEGYFYPTLKLCITVLKSKGKMCVMLGNYHKKLSGEIYDLVGDFENFMNRQKNITRTGMYFLKNRLSPLKNNDKLRGEILFIYEFLN
jgi:hypothetical protein